MIKLVAATQNAHKLVEFRRILEPLGYRVLSQAEADVDIDVEETGTTFNRYLNNVRITKAKELIRRGEYRLTDISQMVGYDDQSYFTKVFRRITGLSPGEYGKKTRRIQAPEKA